MKKLVLLLPLFLSVNCVRYVEEIPSAKYCEIEYVETKYNGLVLPCFDDQKWYRDVVPCNKVAGYRRVSPVVYFISWHGMYNPNRIYLRRIPRPHPRRIRKTAKREKSFTKPRHYGGQ